MPGFSKEKQKEEVELSSVTHRFSFAMQAA
jgi:hypothetical protein